MCACVCVCVCVCVFVCGCDVKVEGMVHSYNGIFLRDTKNKLQKLLRAGMNLKNIKHTMILDA